MKAQIFTKKLSQLAVSEQDSVAWKVFSILEDYQYDINKVENQKCESGGQKCPYCQSIKTRKNGIIKGVQRFICNDCKKNFRSNTGTATMNLKKKEKFKNYIIHFIEGKSIRACANELEISVQTSFDWRHKILSALQKVQDSTMLSGVCESDEIFFKYSEKGRKKKHRKKLKIKKKVSVIINNDRQNRRYLKLVKQGEAKKPDIDEALYGHIEKGTTLYTKPHKSYTAFAKSQNINHQKVKKTRNIIKKGSNHLKNVKSSTTNLYNWISRFRGVATKYLQNYLNWFSILNKLEKSINSPKLIAEYLTDSGEAWNLFKSFRKYTYLN